jgi:hypothetical protein
MEKKFNGKGVDHKIDSLSRLLITETEENYKLALTHNFEDMLEAETVLREKEEEIEEIDNKRKRSNEKKSFPPF